MRCVLEHGEEHDHLGTGSSRGFGFKTEETMFRCPRCGVEATMVFYSGEEKGFVEWYEGARAHHIEWPVNPIVELGSILEPRSEPPPYLTAEIAPLL